MVQITKEEVTPVKLLEKVLEENNLTIKLTAPKTRVINDGGVIVEQPSLVVEYVKK